MCIHPHSRSISPRIESLISTTIKLPLQNSTKKRVQRSDFIHVGKIMRMLNHRRQNEKGSKWYRHYFKWIIWVSLSCYLFTSFFVSQNPQSNKSSLSKNRVSVSKNNVVSSELFKSVNSTVLKQRSSHQGIFNDLKVYVYNLPSKYNDDWLSNERCSNHLFASEVAIHKALLESDVRTFDPNEADFFYVPVYVSCNFSAVNGFPAIGHARSLIKSAIDIVSSELPFWNRSGGSDHVFVASHDFGSCFHTLEDVAIADGVPTFLKNSIILQTFGVTYNHPCQQVDNIVIPPYISPESVRTTLKKANGKRDIFAFFRGKMELRPKNVSGRFYSKRVRTAIWRNYNNDRKFYLKRERFPGYQSEIVRSTFCLCPLGWAPWSPRLVESVALGCVPVIIADGIQLPFSWTVRWPDISLSVAERDIGKLGKILAHVAATNLTIIQKNLMDPAVKRALLFNDHVQDGDATWQVLDALSRKLSRSHKRKESLESMKI